MANEISNMTMATMPSPAKDNGQFVKLEAVKLPDAGQALPQQGKAKPEQSSKPTPAQLQEAVSQINDFIQTVQRDVAFSVDEGSGHTVIKVIDSESGKLVRQIPNEEVLAMASHLKATVIEMESSQSKMPPGMLFSDST